jgi:hypothetical protein
MYKCQVCQQIASPNTKAQRLTLETRVRVYPFRRAVNRLAYVKKEWIHPDDKGGTGREIVREVIACPQCAATHHQTHPG